MTEIFCMIESRKSARQFLKSATRAELDSLIHDANLTPTQAKILRLHFSQEFSICKIALKLNCCESYVRKRLAEIYDKVAKL